MHQEYTCGSCGQPFSPKQSEVKRGGGKFCSRACYNASQKIPLEERFWAKVIKTESCWIWTGRRLRGYGQINSGQNKVPFYTHRLSWEIHRGAIPRGLYVLHHCDNPPCVRPDHLFLGTQADNLADMAAKGRGRKSPAFYRDKRS